MDLERFYGTIAYDVSFFGGGRYGGRKDEYVSVKRIGGGREVLEVHNGEDGETPLDVQERMGDATWLRGRMKMKFNHRKSFSCHQTL